MGFGMNQKGTDEENPPQSGEESESDVNTRLKSSEGVEMEMTKIPVKSVDARRPIFVPGQNKPCIKTSVLKFTLIGFNFILVILGLVILVLAAWVRSDPVFWQYETTLDIKEFYKVCNMLIVAGLVLLLVGFLGCCGATMKSQWMLITYTVLFTIILFLEVASVALVWYAPYNKAIKSALQDEIKNQVDHRTDDDSTRFFMDFLQQNLNCCGSVSQKDYYDEVPMSCRNPSTGNVYDAGCAGEMLKYLRGKAAVIGGMSLPIILLNILALIFSCCLLHRIREESSYPM